MTVLISHVHEWIGTKRPSILLGNDPRALTHRHIEKTASREKMDWFNWLYALRVKGRSPLNNNNEIPTDGTLIRAEEGPKVFAPPPTAYMAFASFSLAMMAYTLGGYNWRHHGDF